MLLAVAALAAPCDLDPANGALDRCLVGDAPLEVRRAALAAADLHDAGVREQLARVLVDPPLHDDVVKAQVAAGLVPAALADRVPTRAAVARALGAHPAVETCGLLVRDGAVVVRCRERAGCEGACQARYAVAEVVDGAVARSEQRIDDGSCGCCEPAW